MIQQQTDFLLTPVEYLKGIGPRRASLLKSELGIFSVGDLIRFYPYRYVDRTRYYKVAEAMDNASEVQIIGKLSHIETVKKNNRIVRLIARLSDRTGSLELVWFAGFQWIEKHLREGETYVVFGRTSVFNGHLSMSHPEMEFLTDHQAKGSMGLHPVYPSSEKLQKGGVTNKVISQAIANLLSHPSFRLAETLSAEILEKHRLLGRGEALLNIHFPSDQQTLLKARFRLKFEELFFLQLTLIAKKIVRHKRLSGFRFDKVGELFNGFYHHNLRFDLTGAQKRVIREIRRDMARGFQMNRLLQGDVGSGKTIVALMCMLIALDNGYQACMMAPTEILAQQHYRSITRLLGEMPVEVALLTGSTKPSERKKIAEGLASGRIQILIGTHAVLEDNVVFNNLGFAVIDEQHRFGVEQRARLWKKNSTPPHILVMTATPIPRTLAMSLYGDLDVSVIDELPPGRKHIQTIHKTDANRLAVFKFIADQIEKGRQAYVVYPLIEESEKMDYKDLMDGYESITGYFPRPRYQVGIVHGKMKLQDKDYEMDRFKRGETQILVATTVIEVGVDVPNASVMVIESAERFGLSQLHQLRGRVGRGAEQSYCILMSGHKLSSESKTRLDTMVRTNDGFEISEADLKLRGPGDIMGVRQSGLLNLKVADLIKDTQILAMARIEAESLLEKDPLLQDQGNAPIRAVYRKMNAEKISLSDIS